MRRVWGWTPASSAATEITYNARLLLSSKAMSDTQVCSRRFLHRLGQRLDSFLLLGGQLLGHGHLGGDEEVAGALAHRHTATLHPEGATRLRARRDLQGHGAGVERGDLDLRPQRGLGIGDRDREQEVPALALEQLMGCDVDDHVEVARRRPVAARAAPALQADALAVVDARRNAHLHLPRRALPAGPATGRTR